MQADTDTVQPDTDTVQARYRYNPEADTETVLTRYRYNFFIIFLLTMTPFETTRMDSIEWGQYLNALGWFYLRVVAGTIVYFLVSSSG